MPDIAVYVIAVAAVLALVAAVAGLLAGRGNTRRLAARMRREREATENTMRTLGEDIRALTAATEAVTRQQAQMQVNMDRRLESMSRTDSENMSRLSGNLSRSLEGVTRQLSEVWTGLGEVHQMADSFTDIKKVLGGVKTRGIWGEVQLRALLSDVLSADEYIENAAIPRDSRNVVEFAVRLPAADGEALLPIDSKFPMEDFLRLTEAAESGDAAAVTQCSAKLERALTDQAKLISEKYIRPPQTADFAVMFLPVESLYAEAVRRPGLCEKLQTKYRILVAGPNTLAALLTSLRMGFRAVTLERRSGEIIDTLHQIRGDFKLFTDAIGTVRQRLDQATQAAEQLNTRADRLNRKLSRLDESTTGE